MVPSIKLLDIFVRLSKLLLCTIAFYFNNNSIHENFPIYGIMLQKQQLQFKNFAGYVKLHTIMCPCNLIRALINDVQVH